MQLPGRVLGSFAAALFEFSKLECPSLDLVLMLLLFLPILSEKTKTKTKTKK